MMIMANRLKDSMCSRMAPSLPQKQNMLRTKAHYRLPTWEVNTQLTYKNWDFAISGHGAFGNYVYNYVAADQYVQSVYSDQGNFSNILRRTKDSGFQNQQLYSDYFLEKGNFFRIDNISLGYTFQKLWNGSSSLRLTLGVQNVATFTGYSGIDPEIYSGIDKEVYPRPRVFSLSANLNF